MKPAIARRAAPPRNSGPGRPKDLEKRAAILAAAKRLFPLSGFDGTSMDAIAAEAGVSKLTVYSHFGDKESLFLAAIRERCEQQMPEALFDVDPSAPVRKQLEAIAAAFFELVTSDDAIALHRLLSSGNAPAKLAQLFWEAGPQRLLNDLEAFLRRQVATGQLAIEDVTRASLQFFALVKGEPHSRMLCGFGAPPARCEVEQHLHASVEMFLRAYGAQRMAAR